MSSTPPGPERPPTDYRQIHRNQARIELFLVVGVLVVGGTGLIGLIWGLQAALLGGTCLLSGALLIGALWLLLGLIQKFVDE